ncbi:hypothetical protein BDN70DRAFT_931094 [Pholiota conissans]|uniref:Glycosyltransferase 2-like domain-containing protein n=1 Tax=Pholiota conissans TaxID=109636 RepID=A0A9P6D291_9AGAR|nr:hypothetical protein BDN70DRAFT_931094 [Pholiota conissans]
MADVHSFQPSEPTHPHDTKKVSVPYALPLNAQDSVESFPTKEGDAYHGIIHVESDDRLYDKASRLHLGTIVQVDSIVSTPSDITAASSARTSRTSSLCLSRIGSAGDLDTPSEGYFAARRVQTAYTPSPRSAEIQFEEKSPERVIEAPVRPLDIYVPAGRKSEPDSPQTPATSTPVLAEVATTTPAAEVPADSTPAKRWWQISLRRKKQATIDKDVVAAVPADEASTLILPSAPTDYEKTSYAQTRRVPLYLFGTISFLSISAGMWLFTISAKGFYWFGIFFGFIEIYLLIFFVIGYVGKDFDLKAHEQLLAEHSYPEDKLPLVDIYLPCCHEPLEILENTYKHVEKLTYPNFKVWVLDDGGLDTVKRLAESYGFNYITRDNKPHLKKAGNLRYAFTKTEGDFFVIFDADFCPRADFLENTLPYMNKYKDIAIVQSPQFFRPCPEQTWVEQGGSATQELFYRVVQVNRDRWGGAICVGSNAMYRREALVEVGGTAEIGHSEDVHTGFYAVTRGWRVKYIPLALACGISPDTPKAYFSQQMRWCSGSTSLLINADFWKSNLTIIQKVCYLSGMMFYASSAAMAILNTLPGLLLLAFNPKVVMWYNCAFVVPSLIYSIFIFRMWSRQKYNFNCNFVFTIQQYAYLMAIKDRIFNTTALWVPSGDNKAHEGTKKKGGNNKYRNMRIFCAV